MFPLPISIPCLKSNIFFIKIALKLNYFCKKMQKFRALGAPPPDPLPPSARGFDPDPQNSPPQMRNSGYAPALSSNVICANPTHKYPNCLFKYYLHLPQHSLRLQERFFSSCTYQKRKHEIKGKLKMT